MGGRCPENGQNSIFELTTSYESYGKGGVGKQRKRWSNKLGGTSRCLSLVEKKEKN
jgi:hypothetical protein